MLNSNFKVIFKIIILLFIILSICSINIYAVVSPTIDFYVNDYAGLLNSETKDYIINTNRSLYNQTGAQIVVVTVQKLEGVSIEEYATELFRNFGIGDANKNNGVLFLLALKEREFRIEVGYGLEGVLPDGKTGRIQDEYIIPYLSQNNWDDGIKNGYNAIIKTIADEYGVEVNVTEPIGTNYSNTEDYIYIITLVLIFIIVFISIKNGATLSNGRGYYGGRGTSRNYSLGRNSSSRSRTSFGGGGSSGGGGSTRKF